MPHNAIIVSHAALTTSCVARTVDATLCLASISGYLVRLDFTCMLSVQHKAEGLLL